MTETKRKRGRPQYGERKVSIHLSISPSDLKELERINPNNLSDAFRRIMKVYEETVSNG